ncbi:MAG: nucleotidyltransferase family protein [Actinocrinis sp.]
MTHAPTFLAHAAAVILAAGAGTRMGGPKALLEFEGRTLVERAVATAATGGCAQTVLVLGAAADEVRRRAGSGHGHPPASGAAADGPADGIDLDAARVVVNEGWAEGLGSSLRAGLEALAPIVEVDAALILLVDQPLIGRRAVNAVLRAWRGGARIACAGYGAGRGHPVLLGREHWAEVARSAAGDRGARGFLARRADELVIVPCDGLALPYDLDVPADLAAVPGRPGG